MEVTSDDFDKYTDEFTIVKNMPSKRIPLNPTVSILDIFKKVWNFFVMPD